MHRRRHKIRLISWVISDLSRTRPASLPGAWRQLACPPSAPEAATTIPPAQRHLQSSPIQLCPRLAIWRGAADGWKERRRRLCEMPWKKWISERAERVLLITILLSRTTRPVSTTLPSTKPLSLYGNISMESNPGLPRVRTGTDRILERTATHMPGQLLWGREKSHPAQTK